MEGNFNRYNDYELLYLVQAGIEEAFDVLIWKYSFMINSRIFQYKIPQMYRDDFYQEGCLTLIKAIKTFDENNKCCFTLYFELLLKRRFINLIKKNYKDFYYERLEDYEQIPELINETKEIPFLSIKNELDLSSLEEQIYDGFYLEYKKANQIAKELNLTSKSVSNAKQRINKKIRNKLNI